MLCSKVLHHLDDLFNVDLVTHNPIAAPEADTEINNTQPAEVATDTVGTKSPVTRESTATAISAVEAPATTINPMAQATVPAPMPMITRLLKQQRSDILEVIETVTDNINQQRADLLVCIPELRKIMCGLMEDHLGNVKLLATKLGKSHTLVREIVEQHHQLEDTVNGTLRQVNQMVMDSKEDWKEYRDDSTGTQDYVVPPEDNLSLGQHAPGSKCSVPTEAVHSSPNYGSSAATNQSTITQAQEATAAQAAPCATATKAAPDTAGRKTRLEEMKRADELLKQTDLDGDRVLMLVQKVTAVSGNDRKEHTTSDFYDKGSTCSMVTRGLVHRLGLPTEKRVLVVQSFMQTQTQTIHSQFTERG